MTMMMFLMTINKICNTVIDPIINFNFSHDYPHIFKSRDFVSDRSNLYYLFLVLYIYRHSFFYKSPYLLFLCYSPHFLFCFSLFFLICFISVLFLFYLCTQAFTFIVTSISFLYSVPFPLIIFIHLFILILFIVFFSVILSFISSTPLISLFLCHAVVIYSYPFSVTITSPFYLSLPSSLHLFYISHFYTKK